MSLALYMCPLHILRYKAPLHSCHKLKTGGITCLMKSITCTIPQGRADSYVRVSQHQFCIRLLDLHGPMDSQSFTIYGQGSFQMPRQLPPMR